MIHFELLRDREIFVITPEGPLEEADFDRLAQRRSIHSLRRGEIARRYGQCEVIPRLGELWSLVSHLKFVADHHRKIERIAAVSDSGFLKIMPRIADHFVQAEIKHFDLAQKDQALAWLESGQ